MTRDDIITLGKQAGFTDGDFASFTDLIVHFGTLVSQHEREACAKIVENYCGAWSDEGYALAAAIRARGNNA
jgi:hypothetical protein